MVLAKKARLFKERSAMLERRGALQVIRQSRGLPVLPTTPPVAGRRTLQGEVTASKDMLFRVELSTRYTLLYCSRNVLESTLRRLKEKLHCVIELVRATIISVEVQEFG